MIALEFKLGENEAPKIKADLHETVHISTILYNRPFTPRPLRKVAQSRVTYTPQARVSTEEILLAETVLYTPNQKPRLLPAGVVDFDKIETTDAKNKKQLGLEELWAKFHDYQTILRNSLPFPDEPTKISRADLNKNYLTKFLFGNPDLAERYARELRRNGVYSIEIHPLEKKCVDLMPRPFVRGIILGGMNKGSDLIADVKLGIGFWNNLEDYRASS